MFDKVNLSIVGGSNNEETVLSSDIKHKLNIEPTPDVYVDKDFKTFKFGNLPIRTILDNNSEVWFVASEVCAALDIKNISGSCSRLDSDEVDDIRSTDVSGKLNKTLIVSESGLYNLIFSSRKEEAKIFKRWVTHEVLPSIRKTGSYSLIGQNQELQEYKYHLASVETQLGTLTAAFTSQVKIVETMSTVLQTVVGHTTSLLAITQDNNKERKQKEATIAHVERKVNSIIEEVHSDRYSNYSTIKDYIQYSNHKFRPNVNLNTVSVSCQVSKYIKVNNLEDHIWTPKTFTKMFLISILDEVFEKYYVSK